MANGYSLDLPPADDLFSTQEERDDAKREKVYEIPLSEIVSFPGHPFKVVDDDAMFQLATSIAEYGVQTPAIVRRNEQGLYESVAGHRRHRGSQLAGLTTMPCIIRQMSRDEAIIFMVDNNLQRERVLPSEKAFSYKMKLDALKRQGKRLDSTSSPVGTKLRSADVITQETGDSRNQIHRYIRLTELIPPILEMVDGNKIAFRPAVEISYLSKDEQNSLYEIMEAEDCTPSLAQAIKMKNFSSEGRLNPDVILSIMDEEKGNQVEQFKMPRERIGRFFPPGTPKERIETDIIKGLELLRKREKDRSDAR